MTRLVGFTFQGPVFLTRARVTPNLGIKCKALQVVAHVVPRAPHRIGHFLHRIADAVFCYQLGASRSLLVGLTSNRPAFSALEFAPLERASVSDVAGVPKLAAGYWLLLAAAMMLRARWT